MSSFDNLAKLYEEKQSMQEMLFEWIEEEFKGSPVIVESNTGGRFSFTIDLPSFTPTEAWGDPSSQNREQIDKVFSVVRGGRSMKAKLEDINKFLDPKAATRFRSPGRILNMMMVVEALQACLNDFNESAAGFVFEGFMAALTGGKQQAERVSGTLPIEDFIAFSEMGGEGGVPVSLKLLTMGGVTKGSYTNIADYLLVRGQSKIKYLVAFKHVEEGTVEELQFWEFEVNHGNFIDFIAGVGGGSKLLAGVPIEELKTAHGQFISDPSIENRMVLADVVSRTAGYSRGLIPGFIKSGGLTPDQAETELSPEEAEQAEKKAAARLAKKQRLRQRGREEQEQFAESFHQAEKRSTILTEAAEGASQWKATWPQLKSLGEAIGLTPYGVINLSQERINELSGIYSEKLKGGVMTLLTETKSLADNIGSYFREKNRSKATSAASTALESTTKISNTLEKDPRYSEEEA